MFIPVFDIMEKLQIISPQVYKNVFFNETYIDKSRKQRCLIKL